LTASTVAVAGDGAVVVPVGTDQVGQDAGVARVALGPGGGVPLAVAAGGQRVDPDDLVAGRDQRADQQATVGLDAGHHAGRVVGVVGQHGVQGRQAADAVRDAGRGQDTTLAVEHAHVVVVLGPVDANEDHRAGRPPCRWSVTGEPGRPSAR
jgi:hypothetical protein